MESNGHSELAIPAKSLFRIGEVSRLTATKQFVLRYWETEFPMLQPEKSPKGHRLYRREDIETVFVIKRLLYDEGFTIAGARRHLRDQGAGPGGSNDGGATPGVDSVSTPNDSREMLSPRENDHDGEAAHRALSPQLATLNRKILLDLRDSLRSLLTVLESE